MLDPRRSSLLAALCLTAIAACGGNEWVRQHPHGARVTRSDGWEDASNAPPPEMTARPDGPTPNAGEIFRNTYYDFPKEKSGDKTATVYDGSCKEIAKVTQAFHDAVCVQGSGRLATGETISFAKRDCECAAICPRSQHKICFDKLDPKQFPTGRGATGKPVTPLRSVAVDTSVVPLGTSLFIQEYVGLPLPGGGTHDGCFRADDTGSRVTGRHVDVFTGDPDTTTLYNRLVPSNQGVTVELGSSRCPGTPPP